MHGTWAGIGDVLTQRLDQMFPFIHSNCGIGHWRRQFTNRTLTHHHLHPVTAISWPYKKRVPLKKFKKSIKIGYTQGRAAYHHHNIIFTHPLEMIFFIHFHFLEESTSHHKYICIYTKIVKNIILQILWNILPRIPKISHKIRENDEKYNDRNRQ